MSTATAPAAGRVAPGAYDWTDQWQERVEFTAACPACGQDATWASVLQATRNRSGFTRYEQLDPEVDCPCVRGVARATADHG